MRARTMEFTLPIVSFSEDTTYLVLKYENKVENHKKIYETLFRLGVETVELLLETRGKNAKALLLVRIPPTLDEKRLEDKISGLEGVEEVIVGGERLGGATFPPLGIQWKVADPLTASIWTHLFISMVTRGLIEAAGESYYVFWYHAGFYAGRLAAKNLSSMFRVSDPVELLKAALTFVGRMGWLEQWNLVEFDPRRGNLMISVKNSQEARQQRSEKPICYLTAGLLAGLASEASGKEIHVKELRCQARGDPECLFASIQYYKSGDEVA